MVEFNLYQQNLMLLLDHPDDSVEVLLRTYSYVRIIIFAEQQKYLNSIGEESFKIGMMTQCKKSIVDFIEFLDFLLGTGRFNEKLTP